MTQMSVAPQSMPVSAPPQAAAVPGAAADSAGGSEAGVDFADVLKAQIAQPAIDVAAAAILAALRPSRGEEAVAEADPANGLPAAPDLSALLPALPAMPAPAGPMPAAALETRNPAATSAVAAGVGAGKLAAPAEPAAIEPAGEDAAMQPLRQSAAQADRPAHAEAVVANPLAAGPQMPAAAAEHANPNASTLAAAPLAAAPLAHAAPAGDAAASVRVNAPVGSRGWDAEVGQKIVLLANRQESRAELTLTPPQLGKVEITISVNGDQTSAAFVSASPAAREALEQALPRLREILAEAGITLGQASVNAETARQDGNGTSAERRANDGRSAGPGDAAAPSQWLRRSEGLIDTFA